MTRMKECPAKGCEIMVPPHIYCCKKHWDAMSNSARVTWTRRNMEGTDHGEATVSAVADAD